MSDLIHQKVAGAGQIEVVGAGLAVYIPRCRVIVAAVLFYEILIVPRVVHPDRAERGLLIRMGKTGPENGPFLKRIREVGRSAVFRIGPRLRGSISKLFNLQLLAAEHDVLLVFAVRAAGGQKHTDGIRGRRGIGIHIAFVAAHQLIHIEVAATIRVLQAVAGVANG